MSPEVRKAYVQEATKRLFHELVYAQDEKQPVVEWLMEMGCSQSFVHALSVQVHEERLRMVKEGLPVRNVTFNADGDARYEGDDTSKTMA